MTDLLTPELLDALESKFSAEKESRQLSWLERSRYKLEVMKFRDALRRSEQQTKAEHLKFRKQHEQKFINARKIMMHQRNQTWEEIVQDFRRQYAAILPDDEEAKTEFKLMLYNKYYFSPTLIGNIVNKPSKTIWLWLEEWAFENKQLKG
ncbi:hypothetical protein [Limosilactobacillus fermentum]|uniref:hypothetical protein n=1 Tax=Limosilactobacillus fermentum TaxID=1613 RepID=UPI0002DB7579|nr:hypothetical protein [Limosilactobacillus fermentum]EQC59885.1 hypothetical protein N219_02785 [Limosilactobacillus fermentum MTCC 8711]GEA96445.1 hypothetical protein LFE01_09230 [Limosilactobacillus fermentum]